MKTSKGFIVPLLLALIALLLLGGGTYVYVHNKQLNQSADVTTSDWEIYSNTQYGFEFMYPSSETIDLVGESDSYQEVVGQKVISIVPEGETAIKITCIKGEDIRCSNIATADGNTIIEQFVMTGNVIAQANLSDGKSLYIALSCDSIIQESQRDPNGAYCQTSSDRVSTFEKILSTFKLNP